MIQEVKKIIILCLTDNTPGMSDRAVSDRPQPYMILVSPFWPYSADGNLNNFPIGSADDPLGLDSLSQDSIIPDVEDNEFSEKSNIPHNLKDPLGLDDKDQKEKFKNGM